jgi:hypothetical protein
MISLCYSLLSWGLAQRFFFEAHRGLGLSRRCWSLGFTRPGLDNGCGRFLRLLLRDIRGYGCSLFLWILMDLAAMKLYCSCRSHFLVNWR